MKKLLVALAALFAATLMSGNAFAFTAGQAKGVQAASAVVKVSSFSGCYGCYRPRRYYYRTCGCYAPAYYYTYNTCGSCYSGCGGWGLGGGFPFFSWFW